MAYIEAIVFEENKINLKNDPKPANALLFIHILATPLSILLEVTALGNLTVALTEINQKILLIKLFPLGKV